jgi:hypothetical protein
MFGYPGGIQVKDVIEDQEKLLSEQIDEVIKVMEENVIELGKLVAEFDTLLKEGV